MLQESCISFFFCKLGEIAHKENASLQIVRYSEVPHDECFLSTAWAEKNTPCLVGLSPAEETYPCGPIASLTSNPQISTSLKLFLLSNGWFGDVDIISNLEGK